MELLLVDGRTYKIKSNDKVRLFWYGDHYIPMNLTYVEAVVVRVKRTGSLEVSPLSTEIGTRTAFERHIYSVFVDGTEIRTRINKIF